MKFAILFADVSFVKEMEFSNIFLFQGCIGQQCQSFFSLSDLMTCLKELAAFCATSIDWNCYKLCRKRYKNKQSRIYCTRLPSSTGTD